MTNITDEKIIEKNEHLFQWRPRFFEGIGTGSNENYKTKSPWETWFPGLKLKTHAFSR
jgi:hypothetical protein